MFLRRALIRLLLLAVCFHTVVGLPAHEASHIQQRIARAAALVLADGGSPRVPGPGPSATALGASAAFLDADRAVWRTRGDGELAGYVQRSGALSHVVVYGAGHLVPADNGRAAQEMIEDWVLGTGLFGRRGGKGRRRAA